MINETFEQRAQAWLAAGPTSLPPGVLEAAIAGIEGMPQDRRRPRLAGRPVATRTLLVAATLALIAFASGAVIVGGLLRDAQPQSPLLTDFPEATTIIERTGGPTASAEIVQLGDMPLQRKLIAAATCTGTGQLQIQVHDRSIQVNPEEAPPGTDHQLTNDLPVPCDGTVGRVAFDTPQGTDVPMQLSLVVPAGVTWQVAVAELRDLPKEPAFPGISPSDGSHLVQPVGMPSTLLVAGTYRIGVQVPEGASEITVLVQCSGDPLKVGPADVATAATEVPCDDASATTRVRVPTESLGIDIAATTDRITWLRLGAEAAGTGQSELPSAPDLPAGVADVPFVEADGNYVAIGRIGGNRQSLVALPGAEVGRIGDGMFGVTSSDGNGGERLELWSVDAGGPVVEVTSVDASEGLYPGPTDGTHGWHYYSVVKAGFAFDWHRVALDGTRDSVIASIPPGWTVPPNGALALDDSVFVIDHCVSTGCTRVIADGATGEVRKEPLDGEQTCELVGVVDGSVVARSGDDCNDGSVHPLTTQPLDGGPRVVLDAGQGASVVTMTDDGARVVTLVSMETASTIRVVDVSGGDPRDVLTFEETASTRSPIALRLPAGDWVLIGAGLGDIPTNTVVRAAPFLLNVATGETIELANLPHTD